MVGDESSASVTQARKRRRPAKSCEQCRQRKIRCDLENPCGSCVRSRASLLCSYALGDSPENTPRADHLVSNVHPGLQKSISRTPRLLPSDIEPEVIGAGQDQERSRLPCQLSEDDPIISNLKNRLEGLEELLQRREIHHSSDVADSSVASDIRELSNRIFKAERELSRLAHALITASTGSEQTLSIPATLPRLRSTTDKTKLFGQSHWLHTAEKLQNVGEFDVKDVEPSFVNAKAEMGGMLKDCRNLRRTIKAQPLARLNDPVPDLLSTIPAKNICDELVHCYLRTFELIYRIVHIPSFWSEYHQFWEDPQSASTRFLMKMVLILAIGTTFYPRGGDLGQIRHLAQTWIYAAQWWLAGPSEKSTCNLDGLQVFCLLMLARQTNSLTGSPCLSGASLLRMAMTMGLHRDPKLFPSLSVFHSEIRRRLWATVMELTVQSSLDAAMSPLLSSLDFDSPAPLNVDDTDIRPDTKNPPIQKSHNDFTDASFQILLLKSLKTRLEVAKLINSLQPESPFETAIELGTKVRSACRDLGSFFHSSDSRYLNRERRPTDFHRKFLDMYLRRYILYLHRPFMIQTRKDPRYYLSRKICLESCMAMASYADNLELAASPDVELDDFSRLIISSAGSFREPLSLDIIAVLGLEVLTQIEEGASICDPPSTDPVDELNKVHRIPIIRTLEHILNQLRQLIALGNPSLKRYNVLSGLLQQIRFLSSPSSSSSKQTAKQVVYDAVKRSLKECQSMLQEHLATHGAAETNLTSLTAENNAIADPAFGMLDENLELDFSSLLYLPVLSETGTADIGWGNSSTEPVML